MVNPKTKSDCCGCEACGQVCPRRCIDFSADGEGFLYPKVNLELCVNCGLCERVCPVINQANPVLPRSVFAAKSKLLPERMASSSGGIFPLLAKNAIARGGVRRKFECPPFPCRNRSAVVGVFGKQVCAKPHRQFFQACRRFLENWAFCAVFGHSLSNIGFEEISWQRLRKLACGRSRLSRRAVAESFWRLHLRRPLRKAHMFQGQIDRLEEIFREH